jgi:sugar lactone lactonase YvrE
MRTELCAVLVLAVAGSCAREPIATDFAVEGVGFATPESVLHDAVADVYLVSNIDGEPTAVDDNGFVSRVAPDGRVLELRWIDGRREDVRLDAPKGVAIDGDVLYVADITALRKFDRRTGAPIASVEFDGATFLNDVSVGPDGTVWVTDSGFGTDGGGAIFRVGPSFTPHRVAAGPELGQPNGIAHGERDLFFVSWQKGEFALLGLDGAVLSRMSLPHAKLDGVVRTRDGEWLVSGWDGKCVYRIDPRGTAELRMTGLEAPADLGYDAVRHRLLIPLFTSDRVLIRSL